MPACIRTLKGMKAWIRLRKIIAFFKKIVHKDIYPSKIFSIFISTMDNNKWKYFIYNFIVTWGKVNMCKLHLSKQCSTNKISE